MTYKFVVMKPTYFCLGLDSTGVGVVLLSRFWATVVLAFLGVSFNWGVYKLG